MMISFCSCCSNDYTHLSSNFQINIESGKLVYPGIFVTKKTQKVQAKETYYALKPGYKQGCIKLRTKVHNNYNFNNGLCNLFSLAVIILCAKCSTEAPYFKNLRGIYKPNFNS